MFDKLQTIETRYHELMGLLSDGAVQSDGDLAELSGTLTTHYRAEALKDAEAVPGTA